MPRDPDLAGSIRGEHAVQYIVQAGDCMSSIAYDHGFTLETLWNDGNNAALKDLRKDPNVLKENDEVYIPDLRLKSESRAADSRSTFKLKGVPIKLKLRVLKPPKPSDKKVAGPAALDTGNPRDSIWDDPEPEPGQPDEPRTSEDYTLDIDGKEFKGRTDGDGRIECSIPPNAKIGKLTIAPNTPDELVLNLQLGHLGPISEVSGVKQRLSNLGYGVEDLTEDLTPELDMALQAFQYDYALDVTGDLDQTTRDKIKSIHGS